MIPTVNNDTSISSLNAASIATFFNLRLNSFKFSDALIHFGAFFARLQVLHLLSISFNGLNVSVQRIIQLPSSSDFVHRALTTVELV